MESYIMKLISVANQPGMISFATGLPDRRLFPVKELAEASRDVLNGDDAKDALQYGTTEGLPSLRKKITDRCRTHLGFTPDIENVFITNGSQECFDHMGKMFLDPRDRAVVENPGYLGALQSFSVYSPKMLGVDLNDEGPDMSQLRKYMGMQPKLFYSIPNHQNPSGMSYSDDRRKEVADLMGDGECVMIEDDAYGELGYEGRVGKTIRSMNDNVVITGSYSKIISPGMRVGWMVVPDDIRDDVRKSLEASCLHANTFSQAIMGRFLERNDLDSYLRPIRAEYRRKRDLMLDLLNDAFPEGPEWNRPSGGMFIWFKTPPGTDAMRLYDESLRKKLVIMPGRPFHMSGGGNTIRLNFATASDDDVIEGMSRLAAAYSEAFQ